MLLIWRTHDMWENMPLIWNQVIPTLPSLLKTSTSKKACRNHSKKVGRMSFAASLSAIRVYQTLSECNLSHDSSPSAILTATSLPCNELENTIPVLPRPRKPLALRRGIVDDKISSIFQYLHGSPAWLPCSVSVNNEEKTRGAAKASGTSPFENTRKA